MKITAFCAGALALGFNVSARADVAVASLKVDLKFERDGHELKLKVKSKDLSVRPNTDETGLQPYVLYYALTKTQDADCETIFTDLDDLIFGDLPDGANLEGFGTCSEVVGAATHVDFKLILEAKSAADVDAFNAYVTAHAASAYRGQSLAFSPAFAIMIDESFAVYQDFSDAGIPSNQLAIQRRQALFGTFARALTWADKASGRFGSPASQIFVEWLGLDYGDDIANYFTRYVLPVAKYAFVNAGIKVIMPDRNLLDMRFGWIMMRDCRPSPSGHCL